MSRFEYKREIQGTKGLWNAIEIPDPVYGKTAKDLSDIRIYGITSKNDTIEAPFFFAKNDNKLISTESVFNLINQSKNGRRFFFTFQQTEDKTINQILLNFEQRNFDWRLKLEGSMDQYDWFTIVENYRILSIKNDLTNYQFNKIVFPDSKYKYYRIGIATDIKPELRLSKMILQEKGKGKLINYAIKRVHISQDKKRLQTIIDIELITPVPVSNLKIKIKDNIDYYRPMMIESLVDSFKTDKSWYFNYVPAQSDIILSSIDNRDIEFESCITNKLKITIDNQNNQPLNFDKFEVRGYKNILIARLNVPARYFLCYGIKDSKKPSYDIEQFGYKNTELANKATPGNEEFVNPAKQAETEPIFTSKSWLWGVMILIILILGWFTFRMMKKGE
jgi:hypothetical protein